MRVGETIEAAAGELRRNPRPRRGSRLLPLAQPLTAPAARAGTTRLGPSLLVDSRLRVGLPLENGGAGTGTGPIRLSQREAVEQPRLAAAPSLAAARASSLLLAPARLTSAGAQAVEDRTMERGTARSQLGGEGHAPGRWRRAQERIAVGGGRGLTIGRGSVLPAQMLEAAAGRVEWRGLRGEGGAYWGRGRRTRAGFRRGGAVGPWGPGEGRRSISEVVAGPGWDTGERRP